MIRCVLANHLGNYMCTLQRASETTSSIYVYIYAATYIISACSATQSQDIALYSRQIHLAMAAHLCTGPGTCRWCQLIGAIAFGELSDLPPLQPLLAPIQAASAAAAPSEQAAQAAPAAATPAPTTATPAPTPATSAPTPAPECIALPPAWRPVEVPVFTIAQRGRDDDFRAASRETRQGARLSEERRQSIFLAQKERCTRLMEFRFVDFWFWGKFLWDALWHSVFSIASQPWVERVCVGVTTDVRWRWADCDGHNNMVPHREHYNVIYPLSCAFGRPASALERLLQSKLRDMLPAVCVHTGYKRGVVRETIPYVLYCCVKHRS